MKKKLIVALVVALLLLAAAVGIVLYMEIGPKDDPVGSTPAVTDPADVQQPGSSESGDAGETTGEPTGETVGISLPTEDPDEVAPEYTWPEDETGSQETAAPVDPDATFDPDENETPEMEA